MDTIAFLTDSPSFSTIVLVGIIVSFLFLRRRGLKKRNSYIKAYDFPESIQEKLTERYPQLSSADAQNVITALKGFFIICNARNGQMISMPSQVVDVAWHEFILHTRQYEKFCHRGLGGFLHHTPAGAMESTCKDMKDLRDCCMIKGLERCWQLSCMYEGVDPRHSAWLPLLFSIDEDLQIVDGNTYDLQQCIEGHYGYPADAHKLSSNGAVNSDTCVEIISCGGGCGG